MKNTNPTITDTPDGMKQLWPTGPRWQTAEYLSTSRHADHSVVLYHVSTDNGYHYALAVVWPDVWHKPTPAFVQGYLIEGRATEGAARGRAQQALETARRAIDDPASVLRAASLVVDARDPAPPGRDN